MSFFMLSLFQGAKLRKNRRRTKEKRVFLLFFKALFPLPFPQLPALLMYEYAPTTLKPVASSEIPERDFCANPATSFSLPGG
jgi:hypothetical protein